MRFIRILAIAVIFGMLNIYGGGKMSASSLKSDICDLDALYNDKFQYCVLKQVMKDFLAGTAFGRTTAYTDKERERLKEDITAIYDQIMSQKPGKIGVAVITAGSPGAGKTFVMRQHLENTLKEGNHFAYIDPDDVCLKQMERTWGEELQQELATIPKSKDSLQAEKEARKKCYDKWRPGSNAAAHIILTNLIKEKRDFYFGSTSSHPLTANSFKFYTEQGYHLHLLHVTAPDDVRWKSIGERDKDFVQTTEEDVREKALLVPQRITDTFLKYADQIDFFYRTEFKGDAKLAATWIRGKEMNRLTIHNREAYDAMVKTHDLICQKLGREDIRWKKAVEHKSIIIRYD